ncbi:uncharacterized protein LOC118810864 [Colossoma macropomum]|uniref:uncharacterized protein LOC118810864 n=1 Tax=Colossoma macropomum TaxID=42526 RepID=UPI0018655A3D|nr:uncharacterized protein LOC118810864 [Colossoma macropomum]
MSEKTLVLEGLPHDLDSVRTTLALYFQNKRRSGGEAARIQQHPEDERKALLVYLSGGGSQQVLSKRTHQVDFKDVGAVQLTVKLLGDSNVQANSKPPILPKPKLKTLTGKPLQAADRQPASKSHKGSQQVLSKRTHQVDFKDVGTVQLTVKLLGDSNVQANSKPPILPKPKLETLTGKPLQAADRQPASKSHKGSQQFRKKITRQVDFKGVGTVHLTVKQLKEGSVQATNYKPPILPKPKLKTLSGKPLQVGQSPSKSHRDLLKVNEVKGKDFGISVDVCKEESMAEKWDPRRFILTGFNDTCKYELVTLFISSCSQNAEHTWELLDEDRIVVTFREDIDIKKFLSECTTKKPQGMDIRVSHLELTDSVLVEGDMSAIREDILTGHFSSKMRSGGGDIKSLLWLNKQKSAVITFKDYHAAYEVVQQKHHLLGAGFTTALFYSRFQKALIGKMTTLSGIPTNITVPVHEEVFNFIGKNEPFKKDFQNRLKMVHANVFFGKSTSPRKIVLEMTVNKESLAALRIGPTWEHKAKREAQAFLTKYTVAELPVNVDVWKRVMNDCLSLVSVEADLSFKETSSKIVIVGLKDVVRMLLDKSRRLLENATKDLAVDRNINNESMVSDCVEMIPLRSVREMEFVESCMNLSEVPEVRNMGITVLASRAQNCPCLKVTGKKEYIQDAIIMVKQRLSSIVTKKLTYSNAGEAKVLKKHEVNVNARCKEWHCKVYLSPGQISKSGRTRRFVHRISRYITLTIAEGDLHQYTADALICPMSKSLSFDNAAAQQLLNVGGSQIQEVCNNLQKEKKALLAGDVFLSKPGKLHTKSLIYAVLPKRNQYQASRHLESAIYHSLHKAEDGNGTSIAMPVLGVGTFGFSIKESCIAIREAILQFSNDYQNSPKNVKTIFVVNPDFKTVEEINTLIVQLQSAERTQSACGRMPENQVCSRKMTSVAYQKNVCEDVKYKKNLGKVVGTPSTHRHSSFAFWHLNTGFDLNNLDPELKMFFDMSGIREADLKDKEMSKLIYDFIQKRGGLEAVKNEFRTQVLAKQPLSSLTTALAAVTFPVTTVEVYGTSPADLAKVKKLLDDLISEECTSRDVQSGYLANLQEADKEAIITLSKNNQVHILVASSDRLTVSGKKDDVLDTVLNISSFIQAAKEREAQESEMKRLRETLCWEVAEGEEWVPLDSSISYQLEFHKKEQSFTYEDEGEVYTVDFKKLTRRNSRGKSCRIRRTLIGDSDTAIIQSPPTWTKMDGKELKIITLHPDSTEYKKIENDFLRSSRHESVSAMQVVKIQRIQNMQQWQRYSVLKETADKKYPNQINERFLYHGTTKEFSQKISKNGFNRSFSGRNGASCGHGTYFAKEAWYSCHDHYSTPDEFGLKYVYRARVVTGAVCLGRPGMKEPDPLDPNNPQAGLYDCAVNNLMDPFAFIVFCDAAAYPDYLIIFLPLEFTNPKPYCF